MGGLAQTARAADDAIFPNNWGLVRVKIIG